MVVGVPTLPPRPGSQPTTPTKADDNATDHSTAIVPFRNNPTYIIQIPKEQIFRVPPPENTNLMKEYQERLKNQQKTPQCWNYLAWILAALLLLTLIGFIAVFIYYLASKPSAPSITVDRISVVGSLKTHPDFDITMRATNPNAMIGFFYQDGGEANLFHKGGGRVGSGDPPSFDIGTKHKTQIKILLRGSNGVLLPKEIQNSLKGLKDIIDLSLSADFPIKLGIGSLQMRKKEANVHCDVRVTKMGKDTHIMSQNCQAKLS